MENNQVYFKENWWIYNFRTYYSLDVISRHSLSVNLEAYKKKKKRKGEKTALADGLNNIKI